MKVKVLVTCLINRLQAEGPFEARHNSYHDEGMPKATGKREDFETDDAKHSSKLEAAVDGEISTWGHFAAQLELGVFSGRQLQMETGPRLQGSVSRQQAERLDIAVVWTSARRILTKACSSTRLMKTEDAVENPDESSEMARDASAKPDEVVA